MKFHVFSIILSSEIFDVRRKARLAYGMFSLGPDTPPSPNLVRRFLFAINAEQFGRYIIYERREIKKINVEMKNAGQ